MSALHSALVNGLIVAGFTALGSMAAFAGFKLPRWGLDFSMSFAAGVMIVVSFTSLIIPGFEKGFILDVGVGLPLESSHGLIDLFIPHEHLTAGYEGPST
jgi:hypothetical protein